jgi:hypothetical protein
MVLQDHVEDVDHQDVTPKVFGMCDRANVQTSGNERLQQETVTTSNIWSSYSSRVFQSHAEYLCTDWSKTSSFYIPAT